jgi:RHS repeat-associated protein
MMLLGVLRRITVLQLGCQGRARVRRVTRRIRRVIAGALGPVLVAAGAVVPAAPAAAIAVGTVAAAAAASVVAATPAHAQSGEQVLVLVQNGETNAPETALLQTAGYSVTQATPSVWAGMSAADFEGYAALVIGDPSAGGSCSSLIPTTGSSGSDALGTTWQGAVSGNIAVLGTAPAAAGTSGANALVTDSVGYAVAGFNSSQSGSGSSGTGLYVSLNCAYSTASAATTVPLLTGVEGIGAQGGGVSVQGGMACTDPGTVNTWEAAAAGSFSGFTSSDLTASAWGSACPVDEAFTAWPAMFTPVAYDSASDVTANFTASDGTQGQPYVLLGAQVSSATAALAPSAGGEVIGGTTAGGTSNPAAPGIDQAAAGDPVNTFNGDFTQSDTDLSLPGFGPSLAFTRTYDAEVAQTETQSGTPGPMGYGWTDNWASNLAEAQPTPGDIYAAAGMRLDSGDGGGAKLSITDDIGEVVVDGSGNIFFADTDDNRIQEIAGVTGNQWGGTQDMTAGDVYTVAGQADGALELPLDQGLPSASGAPATSIVLNHPQGVTVDAAGDLFIADTKYCEVIEVPAQNTGSMQAGYAYTIAGNGHCGFSTQGTQATLAELSDPVGLHFGQGSNAGDLYIADGTGNRIVEVPATGETLWGQPSMSAGGMYTVAGSASGISGDSNSTSSTTVSASKSLLDDPQSVTLNGSNMYIADSGDCRIAEIPTSGGSQWGLTMSANDIYTVAGTGGSCGDGTAGGSARSTDLADPVSIRDPNGNLYISDSGNNRVLEVAGPSSGLTADDTYTVETYASDGVPIGGLWMDSSGNLYYSTDGPRGDLASGTIYIDPLCEDKGAALGGQVTFLAGLGPYTLVSAGDNGPDYQSSLNDPQAVTTDSDGDVFIADTGNNRVQEIPSHTYQPAGVGVTPGEAVTIAGSSSGVPGTSADGTYGPNAYLESPTSVAVDSAGDLFIAEQGSVQMVAGPDTTSGYGIMSMSSGDIYTIAGQPGDTGAYSGNGGAAANATLGSVLGAVAVDKAGDLFIADTSNSNVYEIPATTGNGMTAGDIYAIAGSAAFPKPAAPTGLTVTGTTSSTVSLSWTAPSGTVSGYTVYMGGTALKSSGGQVTAAVSGTTAVVSGLNPSQSYTFTVAAVNVAGTSPQSSQVSATTAMVAPAAPSGLTVTGTTSSTVSLSWTAPSGTVSGYTVYMGGTALSSSGGQVTAAVSGTTAVVSGLSASQSYTFTVQAYNSAGPSPQSASVKATTSMIPPAAPTGLTVTATTYTTASLSWTAPSGTVTGYYVFENGTQLSSKGTITISGTTATVSGLSASKTYTFTVEAYNSGGTSPQSASVQATTPTPPPVPGAPGTLSGTGCSIGSGTTGCDVSLSWGAASGTVTGYDVYENGVLNSQVSGTSASIRVSQAGTDSFYVEAYNSGGTGPASNTVSLSVTKPLVAASAQVTGTISQALAQNTSGSTSGFSGDDEPATDAYLNEPAGLAIDAAGDIYISDSGNNQVREIAATNGTQWGQQMTAGDIYTIAGSPTQASGYSGDGGPADGPEAALSAPQQIALDSAGDLYIADTLNGRIREVAAANGTQWSQSMTAGYIYTVAGTTTSIYDTGNGASAATTSLTFPYGIATDPAGDLYVLQVGSSATVFPQLQEIAATNAASIPADVAGGATSSLYPLTDASGGITVTQPGGSPVTFQPETSTGTCAAPYVQAQSSRWCVLPSFTDASLTTGSNGDYVYTPSPGSDSYAYATTPDAQGTYPLIAETDTAGDILTLAQDTPEPGSGGCPSTAASCETIQAASGRTLTIGYNGPSDSGLITSVTDPMGRSWIYQYTGDQLTSATDPLTNVTSYTYGPGSSTNQDLANDLLTITSPNAQPGGPDAGDSTVNVYDNLGRVITQTDPMGWKTSFNYCVNFYAGDCMDPASGSGYVTVTDPDNNKTVYGYTSGTLASDAQYTASVTTPTSEHDYNPLTIAGILGGGTLLDASERDGDGNVTTYTYNALGDTTSVTSPSSDGPATTTAAFTGDQQDDCDGAAEAASTATCAQDSGPAPEAPGGAITSPSSAPPEGLTWTLYDTEGNELYTTTGVYGPGSSSASYLRTTYQLFNGNTVTLNGTTTSCAAKAPFPSLPCAKINADGVVTQLSYDSVGDLTSSATPDGNGSEVATSTSAYDADGEQTSTTAPDGNLPGANSGNYTTVTTYNNDGEKSTVTQAAGNGATAAPRITTYSYDGDGNQTSIEDARRYTTATEYNADNRATLVTNPDNDAALTCYDGDGNAAQTVPAVGVAANSLTPASCPTSYPSGYSDRLAADATVATYDAAGDESEQTTPAPAGQSGYETTAYTYDGNGNLTRTEAPPTTNAGPEQVTVNTYTSGGQLASQTSGYGTATASTTSYCYDPDGNETAVIAPDGNTSGITPCQTSYPWMVSASYPASADYQTSYGYDSAGEPVSTTTPATAAAPNGATTTVSYDMAGNMLTTTDPDNVTTTYTWTPSGKQATVSYSGSSAPPVTFTYDADGNKIAMADATGSSTYQYDPFGELTQATNGNKQAVTYGYDPDDDVTGITYPLPSTASWATSDTVVYGYDNADQLDSITDFSGNTISLTDNADGLPSTEKLGATGDNITTSYDSTDSPSAISLTNSSSTLQSFTYADAQAGDILNETDTPSSASSPSAYGYDAQGRVTSDMPGSQTADQYGFDPSGNLTTLPNGATGTYDHDGELTTATLSGAATSYTYNADGERLTAAQGSAPTVSATWNGAQELSGYDDNAAQMTDAMYDGDGQRATATLTPAGGSSITEDYVWDGDALLMDSGNAYIYGYNPGTPAEQVNLSTGTLIYLVTDSLGSVRGSVSSGGALTGTTSYDAWGNPQTTGGLTTVTPFGYAGGYTDPDGLLYLINRYYDPATGQFISIDPDLSQTQQAYEYTMGDPVNVTDPTGTRACQNSCSPGGGGGGPGNPQPTPTPNASATPPSNVGGVMLCQPPHVATITSNEWKLVVGCYRWQIAINLYIPGPFISVALPISVATLLAKMGKSALIKILSWLKNGTLEKVGAATTAGIVTDVLATGWAVVAAYFLFCQMASTFSTRAQDHGVEASWTLPPSLVSIVEGPFSALSCY